MRRGWIFVIVLLLAYSTSLQAYNPRLTEEQIEEAIEFGKNNTDLLPLFDSLPGSEDPLDYLILEAQEELAKEQKKLAEWEKKAALSSEYKSPVVALVPRHEERTIEKAIKMQKETVEKCKRELKNIIRAKHILNERQRLEWVEIAVSFDNYFGRIDPSIKKHPFCMVIVSSPFLAVANLTAALQQKRLRIEAKLGRQILMNWITETLRVMEAKNDYLSFLVVCDVELNNARLKVIQSAKEYTIYRLDLVSPRLNKRSEAAYYYTFPLFVEAPLAAADFTSKARYRMDLSNKKIELLLLTEEGEQFNCRFDLSKIR